MLRNGEKIEYRNPKKNIEKGEEPLHTFDLILDGEIIGRAEITYYSRPFPLYQINELYVEPKYQNAGRASEIMNQIESFLKTKKRAGVLVDAIYENSPASEMYKKRGWQNVPGNKFLYAYNLPKNAKLEDLHNYTERQTDMMERESWKNRLISTT